MDLLKKVLTINHTERENMKIRNAVLSAVAATVIVMMIATTVFAAPSLKVKPYGFIKLDASYDTARTNNGNFAMWVNNNGGGDDDSEFNMTARQTRLGANIGFDGITGPEVTGRFEIDFYGAGGGENKNGVMMRHAYMKVDFDGWWLLAGQTSDIISPLFPTTVNYPVLWNSGNIGYRRPQIQIGMKTDSGIELVGALARTIAGDVDADGNDDGEDGSLPTLQARVTYSNDSLILGVSTHYGTMEVGADDDYSSYSVNLHASYIVSDAFSIKGEAFTGMNMNQYFGGIGQTYNYAALEDLETSGGWINAGYKMNGKTSFNLGLGADMPSNDSAAKTSNMAVYANAFRTIAHNTTVAFELSNWSTDYATAAGGDETTSDLRAQLAFIFAIK